MISKIDAIISGYIDELKNAGITSFFYTSDNVLYIYRDELTEEEYTLVEFITELICFRYDAKDPERFKRYWMDTVQYLTEKYSRESVMFYPLDCALSSLCMIVEKEVSEK